MKLLGTKYKDHIRKLITFSFTDMLTSAILMVKMAPSGLLTSISDFYMKFALRCTCFFVSLMDYNLKFIKLANQFNYKLNHKSDTRSFNNTKVDPELASEYKVNLT